MKATRNDRIWTTWFLPFGLAVTMAFGVLVGSLFGFFSVETLDIDNEATMYMGDPGVLAAILGTFTSLGLSFATIGLFQMIRVRRLSFIVTRLILNVICGIVPGIFAVGSAESSSTFTIAVLLILLIAGPPVVLSIPWTWTESN